LTHTQYIKSSLVWRVIEKYKKVMLCSDYPVSSHVGRKRYNWVNPHEKGQYRQSGEKRQIHQQQLNKNLSIHWEQSRSSLWTREQHRVPLPWDERFQGRGWSGKREPIRASGNPDCIIITYLYLCYVHSTTSKTPSLTQIKKDFSLINVVHNIV